MISAVFDCMIFLQAATNRKGPAGSCLALVDEKHVKLFVSPGILKEINDVLNRPKIRKTFPTLTDEVIQDFLDHIIETAHSIEKIPKVFRLIRDPDDEPYLNLAIVSKVPFLVTWDKDLLVLMKDDAFCKAYPGLAIVDPPTFIFQVRTEIANTTGMN